MKTNASTWLLPLAILALAAFGLSVGCETSPRDVPPTRSVAGSPAVYPLDTPKPLPSQTSEEPPPPAFTDPPLVDQQLPEQAWFLNAYNHVGRPHLAVFVNRTLDGELVGSQGAADPSTVLLQPGQYDEANLQTLDYTEMESRLTEWIGCGGQVTLLAPDFLRSHLSQQQVKDIQTGKPAGLSDLAQSIQADVLIQVQAHPIRRGNQVMVLLVGQAINVRGGESLSQASVEMPAPIDRYQLNNFTRFLARKLIHGMVGSWSSPAPTTQP